MPWESVETLTLLTRQGQPRFYRVTGAAGRFAFQWKVGGDAEQLEAQWTSSAHVVTGSELATLISRQTGAPLGAQEIAT
jgi:hypothetical protein